jgi:hypothetical protein
MARIADETIHSPAAIHVWQTLQRHFNPDRAEIVRRLTKKSDELREQGDTEGATELGDLRERIRQAH